MAVCKSTNGGTSWIRRELSATYGAAYDVAIHPLDPYIIFAAGNAYDASNNRLARIYKSDNGGLNWVECSGGLALIGNYYAYSVTFDPVDPNIMYAGCSQGIFKSTNGGGTWANMNIGLSDVCGIIFDSQVPGTMYAATRNSGVHISTDNGVTWSAMNQGLTTNNIECMAMDDQNCLLFAGTFGAGAFRRDVLSGIEPGHHHAIPDNFVLKPNYPNPFNPSTTISFDLPQQSEVLLEIFDISGRKIKVLMNRQIEAGAHSVIWDGRNTRGGQVSSGLYVYRLRAGNFIQTRKMLLMK